MSKLTSAEIIKVLENLIGQTEAVGETYADEKIMCNLKTLIDVTNWCIDGVYQSSETADRPEWSMHSIGLKAKGALDDWREWINDMFEDVEGEEE